jgi:hypothetical protein
MNCPSFDAPGGFHYRLGEGRVGMYRRCYIFRKQLRRACEEKFVNKFRRVVSNDSASKNLPGLFVEDYFDKAVGLFDGYGFSRSPVGN